MPPSGGGGGRMTMGDDDDDDDQCDDDDVEDIEMAGETKTTTTILNRAYVVGGDRVLHPLPLQRC